MKLNHRDYKEIYSKIPRICIDLLVTDGDKFLLTRRKISPDNGKWHLPGGTILFKESFKESIKRIAKSELGINVDVVKKIGTIEFLRINAHEITIVFLVRKKPGKIKLDFQADKFRFFKKIPKNTIKPQFKFLEGYLNV